jgi:hypothetical protein
MNPKRKKTFTGRFPPSRPSLTREAGLACTPLSPAAVSGPRCPHGPTCRPCLSTLPRLSGSFSPKSASPCACVAAAGIPPLHAPSLRSQLLPPLLQGRAACVHATSGRLVPSRAEPSPHPGCARCQPPQCRGQATRCQAV